MSKRPAASLGSPDLAASVLTLAAIVPDGDFYNVKARQCLRQARVARDERIASVMRSLAYDFEAMARDAEPP